MQIMYAHRRATWVFLIETPNHTFFAFSTVEFLDRTAIAGFCREVYDDSIY
jgi:hypothetical protein